MSHFTVMVFGLNYKGKLAPYQENNMCDCPKEYLKFNDVENTYRKEYENEGTKKVIMPDGSYKNRWNEEFRIPGEIGHGTGTHRVPEYLETREIPFKELYLTFEEFMDDWCGYKKRDEEKGKYGYWENPNAKWDWYQVGGRWAGRFILKGNVDIIHNPPNFSYGWSEKDKEEIINEKRVDSAFKKDIDIEKMKFHAAKKAIKEYELIEKFFGGVIPKIDILWEEYLNAEKFKDLSIDVKRDMYHSQPAKVMQKIAEEKLKERKDLTEEEKRSFTWWDLEEYQCTKEEYVKRAEESVLSTFAIIDLDGKWYEKGGMGWWGAVSNEKDQKKWNEEFMKLFDSLPDDTLLTVVDCHI